MIEVRCPPLPIKDSQLLNYVSFALSLLSSAITIYDALNKLRPQVPQNGGFKWYQFWSKQIHRLKVAVDTPERRMDFYAGSAIRCLGLSLLLLFFYIDLQSLDEFALPLRLYYARSAVDSIAFLVSSVFIGLYGSSILILEHELFKAKP